METERHDFQPPPHLEEDYWQALLNEGEYSTSTSPTPNGHHSPRPQSNGHYPTHTAPPPTVSDPQQLHADWQHVQQIFESDDTVNMTVIGYNRGGLLVEWRSLRGFVPASQLVDFPSNQNANVRRDTLLDYIGKKLLLRVIELEQSQNRLVLSQRAAQTQPGERAHILESLQPTDVITGEVTNITDFGVFIDLGGIEGLIHISELSWGRVSHPGDIVKRGETVTAYVLETNKDAGRVALSLKRLHDDPWQTVEERYEIGQVIEVRITNIVDFGAFACVETGLEGLIHVSELAEGHFLHPRNVVTERQIVHARILNIDSRSRRLGLSLRGIQQTD